MTIELLDPAVRGRQLAALRAADRHHAYETMLDEFDTEYRVHHAALGPAAGGFAVAHDRKLAALVATLRDVVTPPPAPDREIARLRAALAERDAEIERLNREATAHEMRFILMDQRIAELEDRDAEPARAA